MYKLATIIVAFLIAQDSDNYTLIFIAGFVLLFLLASVADELNGISEQLKKYNEKE